MATVVTGRRYLLLTGAATAIAVAAAAQRLRALPPSSPPPDALLTLHLLLTELLSTRISALIVVHFFLVVMYHAFLVLARACLGVLRPAELQQTKETMIPFVLLRCQLLVSTMEPASAHGQGTELGLLVVWLAALSLLRALLALTQARFQHLLTRPMTQLRDLQRLGGVLGGIIALNVALAAACSRLGLFSDRIVHVPWFEASLLLLKTLELGVQVGFHSLDVGAATATEQDDDASQGYSENSEFHLLLLQTVLSGCYLVQLVLYYLYVISVDQFRVSLFDLILILNVKNATVRLLEKARHVKMYHQVVLDLDQLFPDASPEELAAVADDVCAICLKAMPSQAKKLRCGHLFHRLCLRQCLQKASVGDALAGLDPLTRMANGMGIEAPPPPGAGLPGAAAGPSTPSTSLRCPICRKNVSAFLSRWVPFPNFSFEIVRHRGFEVTPEMLQQIWEVFPQYTLEELHADLSSTRSVERTMERILNGRLDEQRRAMERRQGEHAEASTGGVLGDAVGDLNEDFRWSLSTLTSALWSPPATAPSTAEAAPRQEIDASGPDHREVGTESLLRRLERWRGQQDP
ncbi:hypothetical protein BBJ28_00002826 [Nothophytophthora sp. Chile5]|nr:hypothetical protein BBJ28_00002826 [Nothophytophthora sp. Chile5]